MKSLNRTLSLVLVLVMVLGMFGIAGAAFTDAKDVKYNEAVDVMSAIGVIDGMNGAFNPKGNLTREQAAKIVCYLTMGKTAADKLTATAAPFKDVNADRWSAGSIAYCVQQGIISGRGDGTFDPTANVTGYEFAKMLLVVLGYDATIEQFTGPSWTINVAKRAFQNDISVGNDAYNGNAPATREEATLYALNTIQAGLVTYATKGTNITLPDGTTVNTGASAPEQKSGSFMKSYYPNLKVTPGTDSFGRAANVWTLKGVEIGAYATSASILITEDKNSATGKQDLAKTLKGFSFANTGTAASPSTLTVSKNGNTVSGTTTFTGGTAVDSTVINTIAGLTGNGIKVEIFVDKDNVKVITGISVIKTDLTVVKAVNTTSKTINLVTFGIGGVQGSYTVKASDNEVLYESLKGLPIDTPVLVTPNYDSVSMTYGAVSAKVPTIVTGKVTATSGTPGAVDGMTVNGTAYDVAAIHSADTVSATVDTRNDATILLDAYGYVVHFKGSTAATANAAVILDLYNALVDNRVIPMAKIVLNDGTVTDVAIASGGKTAQIGDFYKVTADGSAYKFEAHTPGTTAGTHVVLKDTGKIDASDRALDTDATTSGATNYYAPNVKFIFVSTASKTATVKDGVQSVPSISSSGDKLSVAVIGTTTATGATPVVTAVYIVDGVAASTDINSIVYFKSGSAVGSTTVKNAAGNDVPVTLYNGYINGELVKNMPVFGSPADNSFFVFAKNANGSYTIGTNYNATTAGATAVQVNKTVEAAALGRYITVNSVQIDAGAALIVDTRSSADKIAQPIDASLFGLMSALQTKTVNVSVVYNATTGNAAVVYITNAVVGTPHLLNASANFKFYSDATCSTEILAGSYVTAGTQVWVKAQNDGKFINGIAGTTEVTAPTAGTKAVSRFTMPAAAVAANAFTEVAGIALTAPVIASENGVTATAALDKTYVKAGDTVTVTVTVGGTATAASKITATVETTGAALTVAAGATNLAKTNNTEVAIADTAAVSGTFTYSYTVSSTVPTFTIATA